MSLRSDAATVPADAQAAGNSVSHANAYLLYRLIGLYRVLPSVSIENSLFFSGREIVCRHSSR